MAYTPHTWETGEVITAARMNALEQGVAGAAESGGYDAEVIAYHDNNSAHDWQFTVVSGTYASMAALYGTKVPPVVLLRVWDELTSLQAATTAVAVYGIIDDDPPFISFTAQVSTSNIDLPFQRVYFNWDANDEVYA